MSDGLQSFLKTVDTRIGWGRIGVLLSLTIITVAGIVLYRMLREINFEDVIDAVKAVEKHDVVKAAMFVAAGYFTLTFYALFALRTIGRPDIPYRVAALAGLHQLCGGTQCGRERGYRRRGALPHLFALRAFRHRCGQGLLHRGADWRAEPAG